MRCVLAPLAELVRPLKGTERSFTEDRKGSKGGGISEKLREWISPLNFVSFLSFCENYNYPALRELCVLL